jgi:hypothetical protein
MVRGAHTGAAVAVRARFAPFFDELQLRMDVPRRFAAAAEWLKEVVMDTSERGRKRREMVAPREEPESVPPPPRRRKERNELDPEMLWDKETDEAADEYESEEEGGDDEWDDSSDDNVVEDLDDWDHPIRRLKIN